MSWGVCAMAAHARMLSVFDQQFSTHRHTGTLAMLRQIITKHTAPSVVKLQRALLSASATQPIEIDEALHSRLIRFRETLKDALEPVEYIHDSANQVTMLT